MQTHADSTPAGRKSMITEPKLLILQVFTFYEAYLSDLYRAHPGLENASYQQQLQTLLSDGFGELHVLAPELQALGHQAQVIIANCKPLQLKWCQEHGCTVDENNWMYQALCAQVESIRPDIFYSLNPIDFDSRFIRSLRYRPRLIVGWRAAEIPPTTDWTSYDLMLSHLTVCRQKALQHGAKHVEFFHPYVSSSIASRVSSVPKQFDVVFSGQWTRQHGERNQFIEKLVKFTQENSISLGLFLSALPQDLPPEVAKVNRGAVWGGNMYRVLRSGRIVVNAEIDLAGGEAGNMRFFETISCGSFLLTQFHKNVSNYFTIGRELDCFQTTPELEEKIKYYLSNDGQRETIAQQGAERALRDYSSKSMASKFLSIIQTQLGEDMIPQFNPFKGLIDRALDLVDVRDFHGALQLLETSSTEAGMKDRQLVMAVCHAELGDLDKARIHLERELGAFPGNQSAVEMFTKLGFNSAPSRTTTQAPTHTPSATPQPPSIEGIQRKADEALQAFHSGRLSDSIKMLETLCHQHPRVLGLNMLLTQVFNSVGRHEEALKTAKRELELDPTNNSAREQVQSLTQALLKSTPPLLHPEQRSYRSEIPASALKSIQNASHNYSYKGIPMIKNPFDFALYPLLLWNVKPRTIIEIGSKNGGSAVWMGDLLNNYNLDGKIVSVDIVKVEDVSHPRVTFLEGDGRNLGGTLTDAFLESLPRPWLVIEDADHSYETSSAVLKFFHPRLRDGEYIVIEDGIISDLSNDPNCNSGPHKAIKEHILAHTGEYEMDSQYLDYFGKNFTWCSNGFLRKKQYPLNQKVSKSLLRDFNEDDTASTGIESQMSLNERFQLYAVARSLVSQNAAGKILFAEIGSYTGASLALTTKAFRRCGRPFQGLTIEPGGQSQFYETLPSLPEVRHIKALSNQAVPDARLFSEGNGGFDFIFVDGDHSYEGVADDIRNYYPLLKPGGVIAFHDFLPALSPENRDAIFYHHGGKEPGIRRACLELMEGTFGCAPLELEIPYPTDPTQTQPHLPVIPGVVSTVRMYQKPI